MGTMRKPPIEKGRPPYAAQYVGTYQPLLGWAGRRYKQRIDGAIYRLLEMELAKRMPLPIASDDVEKPSPYSDPTETSHFIPRIPRLIRKLFMREKGRKALESVRKIAKEEGRHVAVDDLLSAAKSIKFTQTAKKAVKQGPIAGGTADAEAEETERDIVLSLLNDVKQSEILSGYVDALLGKEYPEGRVLTDWAEHLAGILKAPARSVIDLTLSPIGLLDVYRHYYFDVGAFLGPPVDHIWVAPKSEVELTETYTETTYRMTESEQFIETIERSEEASTKSTDLSEEVERQSMRDTKIGVSCKGGVDFLVWKASASATLDLHTNSKRSRKVTTKESQSLTRKVATESRRTVRTRTQESFERTRYSSRRHTVRNDTDKVLSIELRRKMRRMCIVSKHLGAQLCWSTAIDEPGLGLGLAELVHVAKPADFGAEQPPDDALAALDTKTTEYEFDVQFIPENKEGAPCYADTDADFIYDPESGVAVEVILLGGAGGSIRARHRFTAPPPQPGYELADVRQVAYQITNPDHDPPSCWSVDYKVVEGKVDVFDVILRKVNFEKQPAIRVTAELIWKPSDNLINRIETQQSQEEAQYNMRMQRAANEAMVAAMRSRVRMARSVEKRPTGDLREEERHVLFRRLLRELIGESEEKSIHLIGEQIRSIFAVEEMLFFVASDWWNPRRQPHHAGLTAPARASVGTGKDEGHENKKPEPFVLSSSDRVKFGGPGASRQDNYLITEDSEPAALGSSLGWLVQLDGDAHRNAFLNAAYVTTVVPIRHGKEAEAIEWLRKKQVEGAEGLDATYIDENGKAWKMTLETKLKELAAEVSSQPDEGAFILHEQQVFENGFDPSDEAFVAPNEDELPELDFWTEIMPTNQVVPVQFRTKPYTESVPQSPWEQPPEE